MNKKELVWIIVMLLIAGIATALSISDSVVSRGIFNGTHHNDSGFVVLNGTMDGTYVSQIIDVNGSVQWDSVSWIQGGYYGHALPDSKGIESGLGGADMTNNVVLLHMNETSGNLVDQSGEGHTGEANGAAVYNDEGKFGRGIGFDGVNDYFEVADAASLDITDELTIEAWMKPSGNGRAVGEILNEIDSLEFDTSSGLNPAMIKISGNVYAIAYQGSGDDGFIETVTINDTGSITNPSIDLLEFDTGNGREPSIVNVAGEVYAVAYRGRGNDGFVKTIQIEADGSINDTIIDELEYETSKGLTPDMIRIDGGVFAIAYRGPGDDGYISTILISDNGLIQDSVVDTFEYDTAQCSTPEITRIADGNYAVVYTGQAGDGFIKTVGIENNGTIDETVIDSLEFDTSSGKEPKIINIDGDIYSIAYRGAGGDAFIKTIEISEDGQIGDSVIDEYAHDTRAGNEPSIVTIGRNIYGIAYGGDRSDGYLSTIKIDNNGSIDKTRIDSLEFDTSKGLDADIIYIGDGVFAIAYAGSGNDGYLKTFEILDNKGIFKGGAYGIDADNDAVYGMINNNTLNADASSGWAHIVMTYDLVKQRLYVNGMLESESNMTENIISIDDELMIGRYYNGTIDEIAIYNSALTNDAVLDRYRRGILGMNMSIRSCDDPDCAGEEWNVTHTDPAGSALAVEDNQYIQYMASFMTADLRQSPEFYNATFTYSDIGTPSVYGMSPMNESYFAGTTIQISANATDDLTLDSVRVQLRMPNGSLDELALTGLGEVFSVSYVIPETFGRYNITYTANDTSGNVNDSQEGYFIALETLALGFNVSAGANNTGVNITNSSYVIRVANNGTITDNYSIALIDTSGSSSSVNETAIYNLVPDETRDILLLVNTSENGNYTTNMTITSAGNNSLVKIVSFLTEFILPAGSFYSFNLSTDENQSVVNITNTSYVISIMNDGTAEDNYTITTSETNGITSIINKSTINGLVVDGREDILTTVNATENGNYTTNVTITSSGNNSLSKIISYNTEFIFQEPTPIYDFNLSEIINKTVINETNTTYTLRLTNNGTASDNYTITASSSNGSEANLNHSTINNLNPNNITDTSITINATNSGNYTTNITITPNSNNNSTQTITFNTEFIIQKPTTYSFNLSTDENQSVVNITNTSYTITIMNDGTAEDNYTITTNETNGITSTLNKTAIIGLIVEGRKDILITMNATENGNYTTNVTITSSGNNSLSKIISYNTEFIFEEPTPL